MLRHERLHDPELRILGIHERFQNGRATLQQSRRQQRFLRRTLVVMCNLAGLWKPTGWKFLWCLLLSLVCLFQLGTRLYSVCEKVPSSDKNLSQSKNLQKLQDSTVTLSSTAFTLSSVGTTMSYLMLLYCFVTKIRSRDNCALAPWDAIEDLNLGKLKLLTAFVVVTLLIFLACFVVYMSLAWQSFTSDFVALLKEIGTILHFVSHAIALVGCLVFAICTLALGTLANDTIRHMRDTRGGLDALIQVHEELCRIVFDTVSAFAPWFLVHWLIYATTIITSLVYVTVEYAQDHGWSKPFVWFFTLATVNYLFIFLLPCFNAAYVTSTCGGIAYKINKTTANNWPLRHPFRERNNIHLFLTYTKERQCVFKIGRITFTSTIAWISLLLASIGLVLRLL